jgi:hypothetical protein
VKSQLDRDRNGNPVVDRRYERSLVAGEAVVKSPIHKKVKIDHTLVPVSVGNSILPATDIESGNAPALCERIVAPAPGRYDGAGPAEE